MKVKENKKLSLILWIFLIVNVFNSFALIGAYLSTHISPTRFVYFSFLGLSYPIWISIAVLFIIFWFFYRRKFIWISIITILIGFNHLRHFYAFNIVDTEITTPLKFVSYNVHIFNLYDKENRIEKRNKIFSFLKQENAGVYCFQEFYHQDGKSNFVTKDSMVKLLETPYNHERYTHEMTNKRYFGVATFSKYPILHKGEISFDNDDNNFCIYSDIVCNKDTFRVFNAHIGSIRFQKGDYRIFEENEQDNLSQKKDGIRRILRLLKIAFEKRSTQAEKIALEIEKSPYPVVLCGDLNDTPVSYCYRQFNRLLKDAFIESGNGIGKTYIGVVPSNRIDYIFYSDELKSNNFQTHDIDYSDHKPISVEIGK